MGLAEPRKRLKISHDPNNLAWSQSNDSYGQRLLLSQGWKAGEGLGARDTKHHRHNTAEVGRVTYKDDLLGLGAKLTSKNVEHARTGLDAFQGLLGRLNGKSDVELQVEERKLEDRKLAMWAQGRWGGMTFVSGGVLVQGEAFKSTEDTEMEVVEVEMEVETGDEQAKKARRKDERRRHRKEEKLRLRETQHSAEDSSTPAERSTMNLELESKKKGGSDKGTAGVQEPRADQTATQPTPASKSKHKKRRDQSNSRSDQNSVKSSSSSSSPSPEPTSALRPRSLSSSTNSAPSTVPPSGTTTPITSLSQPRNGRHILRGRNIQAKRMAFADAKMLDEIFMRKT